MDSPPEYGTGALASVSGRCAGLSCGAEQSLNDLFALAADDGTAFSRQLVGLIGFALRTLGEGSAPLNSLPLMMLLDDLVSSSCTVMVDRPRCASQADADGCIVAGISQGQTLDQALVRALEQQDWLDGPLSQAVFDPLFLDRGSEDLRALGDWLPPAFPAVGSVFALPLQRSADRQGLVFLSSSHASRLSETERAMITIAVDLFNQLSQRLTLQSEQGQAEPTSRCGTPSPSPDDHGNLSAILREAVAGQHFSLVYQPQVCMRTGTVSAAEALLRWTHSKRGPIAPAAFVPLAEANGLIDDIEAWVIGEVCRQQAEWIRAGLDVVPVSVNISPVHFHSGTFEDTILTALQAAGIPSGCLQIKLPERAMLAHADQAVRRLARLSEMGVSVVLDDFGPNYSSLIYLKRFSFDAIKMDPGLVRDLATSRQDQTVVSAVITMAHRLGLSVVAKGIEDPGQLSVLRQGQCDDVQGYLFSHPLSASAFADGLRDGQPLMVRGAAGGRDDTVLLVADDWTLLQDLQRALLPMGHRVLMAMTGLDALQVVADQSVSVVVSDQSVADLSVTDLFRAVHKKSPNIECFLLMDEADLDRVMTGLPLEDGVAVLLKPCPAEVLQTAIRDALCRRIETSTFDGLESCLVLPDGAAPQRPLMRGDLQ